ncbi:MAG TPA: hypothetical protein VGP93_09535, partial [Polyangiaceae bacterium]|nr:hypothetical protein [Polyangiaceae bacterium]
MATSSRLAIKESPVPAGSARGPERPPLPNWQALLTPVIAYQLWELRIGLALWLGDTFWSSINFYSGVLSFEHEHGVETKRWAYNLRCFAEVERTRRSVRGEHAGFHDLFVPVQEKGELRGILVAGPFAVAPPTAADILERWFFITRSHGRLGDPSFSEYVTATLATFTLEGAAQGSFERLLWCFAHLIEGGGAAGALGLEVETLLGKLSETRASERMWAAARSMVNERKIRAWTTRDSQDGLTALGLARKPQHAIVGLVVGREEEAEPVDELLRRQAFQRACTVLARKQSGVISGQVGDRGVVFLVDSKGSAART